MLIQSIQLASTLIAFVAAAYMWRENGRLHARDARLRHESAVQTAEMIRLREQNQEMQQLVADAAAQATLDSEASAELLSHLQAMRAENAALKGRQ